MISRRAWLVLAVIGVIALAVWRSQLFTVSAPGETPQALALIAAAERAAFEADVVLPVVPVGLQRLHPEGGVSVIHYWAPWEKGSLEQAQMLDSLRHLAGHENLHAWIVTFDPFPSVARYVGRNRLGVPVLMDGHRELRRSLPCPSIPFTYVIDARGRIAVAQPGRVNWFAEGTRKALAELLADRVELAPAPAGPVSARGAHDPARGQDEGPPAPRERAADAASSGSTAPARAAMNTPARITTDPASRTVVGASPSTRNASSAAPTGSPNSTTATGVAGRWRSAQLNVVWPISCGTIASSAIQPHVAASSPATRRPVSATASARITAAAPYTTNT
jgi:hypothetical protein